MVLGGWAEGMYKRVADGWVGGRRNGCGWMDRWGGWIYGLLGGWMHVRTLKPGLLALPVLVE